MPNPEDEFVVYYSDLGLSQHGALKVKLSPEYHRARIKALLLLSDAVHIPLSHLLSLNSKDFEIIVGGSSEFFARSMVRFRLSSTTKDLHSYIGAFGERPGKEALVPTLENKEQIFKKYEIRPMELPYSGSSQTSLLKRHISGELDKWGSSSRYSDADLAYLHKALAESDSKEGFDRLLQAGNSQVDSMVIKEAKELSDVFYYFVGAETNGTIMSANQFLSQERLQRLGIDSLSKMPFSGDLYDPLFFGVVLKAMGAVDKLTDLDCLTLQDIREIKSDLRYHCFIRKYHELYKNSASCVDMLMRVRGEQFLGNTAKALIVAVVLGGVVYGRDVTVVETLENLLSMPVEDVFNAISQLLEIVGVLAIGAEGWNAIPVKNSKRLAESIACKFGACTLPMHQMARLLEEFIKKRLA